jgi:hypothetical protein
MELGTASLPGVLHATLEVTVATFAGLVAVIVGWPILILATAIKAPIKARRNRASLSPYSSVSPREHAH